MNMLNTKKSNPLLAILPIILGVMAFLLVVGPNMLDPTNIAWIVGGDPTTHYLGWLFFRHADWSFPIGLNPNYGLELGSAIIYSDSNPLSAFLFKPFNAFLPDVFQYFGFWALACFTLQSWFGWKLVGLISDNTTIRLLGAGLFVFSPPMLWRLHGHLSLMGHFLILAALYLALRPTNKNRFSLWGIVLVAAALTNAYLLAMVALLWISDLAHTVIKREQKILRALIELFLLFLAVTFACWQAGYFSISSGTAASGFGFFRMNLFSIINPDSWSYILQNIPADGNGDYEGFNFLGSGVIILFLLSAHALLNRKVNLWGKIVKKPLLLLSLIGLTLFALSNNIGISTYNFEYPLPEVLLHYANVFRSSGRMFWPVFYMLVFTIVYLTIRGNNTSTAIIFMTTALIIQITDTSATWSKFRDTYMAEPTSKWETTLNDPFWLEAAKQYKKIRTILPSNIASNWEKLTFYSGTNKLGTDAIYLARIDEVALVETRKKTITSLQTGEYETDSLYIINPNYIHQAVSTLNSTTDSLFEIDGLNVLAPNWKSCDTCNQTHNELTMKRILPQMKINEKVHFKKSDAGISYLTSGWSEPETHGVWSEGEISNITLPLVNGASNILIEGDALITTSHPTQNIEIYLNKVLILTVSLSDYSDNQINIAIPPEIVEELKSKDLYTIEFKFPNAVRPKDIGLNDDTRTLAFHLKSITIF